MTCSQGFGTGVTNASLALMLARPKKLKMFGTDARWEVKKSLALSLAPGMAALGFGAKAKPLLAAFSVTFTQTPVTNTLKFLKNPISLSGEATYQFFD